MPAGRDLHIDTPLSNFAVQAFSNQQDYVASQILPIVPVEKQSNKYYVLDRDSWLMVPASTLRAPKTPPRRVDWKVSSDSYFCHNYALANDIAKEDLSNADAALQVRQRATAFTTEMLLRDYEQRVATLFTTFGNYNAYTSLSNAADKWSATSSADIVSQISSAQSRIRQQTGFRANTLIVDYDSYQFMRRSTRMASYFLYTTQNGFVTEEQMKSVLDVQNIIVAQAIKNTAKLQAGTSVFSSTNIWGNNAVLCYLQDANSLQAMSFAASFRWQPDGIPAAFQVYRYDDPDPGKKAEVIECGYYQTEKIIAPDLGYLITNTK
jgi:hypothetical protein